MQQPAADPTPEPAPVPTGPTETGANGAGCFLTSAGLICPGDPGAPSCVVTSAGVSCAENCIVTSAGLSCPQGVPVGNPPRGGVLGNPPISGGRNTTPTPTATPKSQPEGNPPLVPHGQETAARALVGRTDGLAFTGAPVLAWLAAGCALLAGGLLLRRRTSRATRGHRAS